MQNTHGSTRLIGRAALVALFVAPVLSAQDRREDRDQRAPIDSRERDWEREARERESRDRGGESWDRRRDEQRRLFTWRGTVDDDTRIYVRAGKVVSQVVSGRSPRRNERVDRDSPLPRHEGTVRVELIEGRGRVHVVQQPSARNNYTAIVRVKDAQSGTSRYRFATYFDPVDDTRRSGRGGVWGDGGGDVRPGDQVFRWAGSVDGDVRITLRRGSVGYEVVSGEQPRVISASGGGQLPRRDGRLGVSLRQGRGTVSVVQQPASYNNYTAIIRVVDRPSGFGYYEFDLIWQ